MTANEIAKESLASVIRKRGCLVLILSCVAFACWLIALIVFRWVSTQDVLRGFYVHPQVLWIARLLVFGSCLFVAARFRLSLGWPVAMFIIAILVSILLVPAEAVGENQLRLLILDDSEYGLTTRKTSFIAFAVFQILGIAIAQKKTEQIRS